MSQLYSVDSSELSLAASGSRLLSKSPLLPSTSSHSGSGIDDLSISELSLSDRPQPVKPFSLLAKPEHEYSRSAILSHDEDHNHGVDFNEDEVDEPPEDAEKRQRQAVKTREEKLQNDLFILKKLNSTFALYKEALRDAQSGAERVSVQLKQTDALLNKYSNILSKSEAVTRLIFDERWQGADLDEEIMEQERREAHERARREAEERALAARRERERIEREEQERKEREEKERIERDRRDKPPTRGSGVRGVRGTRASMRGMTRGAGRGAPTTTTTKTSRAQSLSANPSPNDSNGVPAKRPMSSASLRPPAVSFRGAPRRS